MTTNKFSEAFWSGITNQTVCARIEVEVLEVLVEMKRAIMASGSPIGIRVGVAHGQTHVEAYRVCSTAIPKCIASLHVPKSGYPGVISNESHTEEFVNKEDLELQLCAILASPITGGKMQYLLDYKEPEIKAGKGTL